MTAGLKQLLFTLPEPCLTASQCPQECGDGTVALLLLTIGGALEIVWQEKMRPELLTS